MPTQFPNAVDALYDLSGNPPMNDPTRRASVVMTDIQDAIKALQAAAKVDYRWRFTDLDTTVVSSMGPFTSSAGLNSGTNTSAIVAADYPASGPLDGFNYIRSGGSANGGFRYSPPQSYRGHAGLCFRSIFMPRTSVASTAFCIGLHNATTAASEPTNGAYLWVTAGGSVVFKTAKNGTRSSAAVMSSTLAAGVWYTVDIWYVNSTTVRCVVTVTQTGSVSYDVTLSTNVPNTTSELIQPSWMGWNSNINADVALVDMVGFGSVVPPFMLR